MTHSIYTPSVWGQKYHSLTQDEALGAGSAGPGKSLVLLYEPLQQIVLEHARCADPDHPHRLNWGMSTGWALHLRRQYKMLAQTLVRAQRSFPLIDPGARWVASENTWIFSSGYRYQFGHCNDADDWDQYMSSEFSLIMFDELVQFQEEQYDQVITRLRSSDPLLSQMLKVRSMSNPVMRRESDEDFTVNNPYWVRERFVEPARDGNVTLKRRLQMQDGTTEWRTWIYLPARLSDNPDPAFARNYEKQLQSAKPYIRRALLDGDWYVTAHSYFGDVWNERLHICPAFKIPGEWPVCRSMDWGYKTPGCIHWAALDPEGTAYVFEEYYFQGKTADEVAKDVRDIEKRLGLWGKNNRSRVTGPADTQLWEQRGNVGKSKAQEFLDRGVPWVQADKKSRQANAERLAARLGDHAGGTKNPGIVFFSRCRNILRTLPSIQTNPKNVNEPADGGDDHAYDSVSYLAAYLSRGPSYVGKREDDEDDYDKEESARRSRGQSGYGEAY